MQIRSIAAAVLLMTALSTWAANPTPRQLDIDETQVVSWNRFAARLYDFHKQRLAGRDVRQTETTVEYGGTMAKGYFYKETSYHDARSGLLLGRVRVDRDKPEILHMVEVFLHDDQGRLIRDYAAIYLPWSQNAPIRTMINVHHHQSGLSAYRQFDASGNRIYEQCKGAVSGKKVEISLEQQEINARSTGTQTYRACFAGVQETAGIYLSPQ
jgi:hypothetical protein